LPTALEHPTGFGHLLDAFERAVTPPIEVVVVGPVDDPRTDALWREVVGRLLPSSVVVRAAGGPAAPATPLLEGRDARGRVPTAYVCEHYACRAPVTEPSALAAELDAALAARGAAARR
ncbi:MAG: hypothetical protein WEB19_02265, partial [Acidimicrobiia bacterium]